MARYGFLSVFLTSRSRVTVTWVNSLKSPMVRLGIVPEQSAQRPRICRRLGNGGEVRKRQKKRGKGVSQRWQNGVEMLKMRLFGKFFGVPRKGSRRGAIRGGKGRKMELRGGGTNCPPKG